MRLLSNSMPDALIAGGGPAGAIAATLLARAGRDVVLLERDAVPADRICGEFLSREALDDLAAVGIDVAALGACPIETVRLVRGSSVAEARLPFHAASLSRRTLDAAMLDTAAASGASLRRGTTIRALEAAGDGAVLRLADGSRIGAPILLLATGKHELRGAPRQLRTAPPDLVGFKTFFALSPIQACALEGRVEIVLFNGAYAGLQPVEGGRANLCLLAARSRLEAAGSWDGLLASLRDESPWLAARLDGARALLPRPLSVARVPYGFVHRGPDRPGLFRVGDQMAVIPSFCGDGIAIALHSGAGAARAVLAGEAATAHHHRMRRDAAGPVRLASLLAAVARTSAGQRTLVAGFRAWPAGMRLLAGLTRVR